MPRLNAAISALGFDVLKFKVILYQWVRFRKHGKPVSMSKRAGNFVAARDVVDEIGSDAVRFMILMHDSSSPIDFDLEIAKEKSAKNPVYYVQYAYARICSIMAKAGNDNRRATIDYSHLSSEYEIELIKKVCFLPELVQQISKSFEVHHLTNYALELADSFHKFYENCVVISDDAELSAARLGLTEAVKIALANTLKLLGVTAPAKM